MADALADITYMYRQMLRTVEIGGDALGSAPGGKDRAKGYSRALLDAAVCVLTERADDDRPVAYGLARAVLKEELSQQEALHLHALGYQVPM